MNQRGLWLNGMPGPITDRSRPHVAWGETVLERLSLRGDEIALDAGCGTGKLTAQLLRCLPQGKVIALDRSQNMLDQAKNFLGSEFLASVIRKD
jgi:ubiquinone/menaquinone biosynthesis C-methylase UbiE